MSKKLGQFSAQAAKALLLVCLFNTFLACSSNQDKQKSEQQANIYYTYGTKSLIDKEYSLALEYLLQAVNLREKDSNIHNNLGMAYYFKKDLEHAKFHLNRALEIDPKNSDARNNLASIYFYTNDLKQAEFHYLIVKNDLTYLNNFRTLYNLALIDLKKGKKESAIAYLNQAIEERPDYCPALYKRAELSEIDMNYQDAVKQYEKATMGECVNLPDPHFKQAQMLSKLKRYHQAETKFNEIIERFSTTEYAARSGDEIRKIKATAKQNEEMASQLSEQELKHKLHNQLKDMDGQVYESPTF